MNEYQLSIMSIMMRYNNDNANDNNNDKYMYVHVPVYNNNRIYATTTYVIVIVILMLLFSNSNSVHSDSHSRSYSSNSNIMVAAFSSSHFHIHSIHTTSCPIIIRRHYDTHTCTSSSCVLNTYIANNNANNNAINWDLSKYCCCSALTSSRSNNMRMYSSLKNGDDNGIESESESEKQSKSDEDDKSTGEKILSLAVPALASLAIDPLMTLVDTAFVGRYSVDSAALSGMGSAAALLIFSFYIFNFLCTATTPLVSIARAKNDEGGAIAVGGQALSLAISIGVVLCLTLQGFHEPLLNIMGTEYTGELANSYAQSFLQIRALAAPAVFLCSAAVGILRGYLDTKTAIVILAAANTINFMLDVVLIAGMGLGPIGAAIATTTAEWLSALSFLLVLAGKLPSADGKYLGSNQIAQRTVDFDTSSSENTKILTITPTLSVPKWSEIEPLIVASSSVFLRSVVLQLFLSGE